MTLDEVANEVKEIGLPALLNFMGWSCESCERSSDIDRINRRYCGLFCRDFSSCHCCRSYEGVTHE